jgi:cyclopropane fatty-acyl-phospholipid synthase-like methyltransferase
MSERPRPPSNWDERYRGGDYVFGTEPNRFLVSQAARLKPGMHALAVADGEGRNGVWLAERGLDVLSVDSSQVGLDKAKRLAAARGVTLKTLHADLATWEWPGGPFDVIVAIFIQFANPDFRSKLFAAMIEHLAPGGLLLLEGYRPKQLEYRTGGPPIAENLYTADLLRDAFRDLDIVALDEYDAPIAEGRGHNGMSALIDLVAKKPAA